MKSRQPPVRSTTGGHTLLPAAHVKHQHVLVSLGTLPMRTFLSFTFGRSTVIWRIWPAVLFHTAFAALVVTVSLRTTFRLAIPNVLLTLLGVVIGFVISYRCMSGYDRYWQGRSSWSDIIRTSRTFARLVWYHVPLRMVPQGSKEEDNKGKERDEQRAREVSRLMAEKKMALELIEGFAVAVKHHLRGEPGIYYQDMYLLVKPLHNHSRHIQQSAAIITDEPEDVIETASLPGDLIDVSPNPVIPPINSYGASSTPSKKRNYVHHASLASFRSLSSSLADSQTASDERQPLLPSTKPTGKDLFSNVSGDLIPFSGVVQEIANFFKKKRQGDEEAGVSIGQRQQRWWTRGKHRPKVAGGRDNVPLQIVRCLTTWLSVLEERGSCPGTTLGGMFGCLSQFEDSLVVLEKILTTPLPFVFSVHISTVWLYLFALPFQLVDLFGWYTIPGVGIASFIYLGFVATGEEIEQPFGYDENDLDLDMFCQEVIRPDMQHLKNTPTRNAQIGPYHDGEAVEFDPTGEHGRIEEAFGYYEI